MSAGKETQLKASYQDYVIAAIRTRLSSAEIPSGKWCKSTAFRQPPRGKFVHHRFERMEIVVAQHAILPSVNVSTINHLLEALS